VGECLAFTIKGSSKRESGRVYKGKEIKIYPQIEERERTIGRAKERGRVYFLLLLFFNS